MQLNIYVPKDKEKLLDAIKRMVKKKNTTKNKLVLEALEKYLAEQFNQDFEFGVYNLKAGKIDREDIYREHLNRKMALEGR